MSDTPKKKTPAKKATAKKKATPKSDAPAKRGRPPKQVAYKPDAKDGDGDGLVQDGTPFERMVAPKEEPKNPVVIHANDVKKASLRKRMMAWFKK